MKNDLGLRVYKIVIEPLLADDQKIKRKKFVNWIRTNFLKEDTIRILFSDEEFFDIDGLDNSQNDRVWAGDHDDANKKGGIKQRRKFLLKVMVWLGAFSKGVTPLVILNEETVDHTVNIKKVLVVPLKMGMKLLVESGSFNRMVLGLTRIIFRHNKGVKRQFFIIS